VIADLLRALVARLAPSAPADLPPPLPAATERVPAVVPAPPSARVGVAAGTHPVLDPDQLPDRVLYDRPPHGWRIEDGFHSWRYAIHPASWVALGSAVTFAATTFAYGVTGR